MRIVLVISFCLVYASPAMAQFFYYKRGKSPGYDISAHYLTVSDLKMSSSSASTPKPPMAMMELGIRIYHTFHLIILGGTSLASTEAPDEKTNSYGVGMKINTPGFFFLGSKKRHLFESTKRKPFNTSIYGALLANQTTKSSVQTNNYAMVVGFEMDLFVISTSYLKVNMEIHNKQGDFFTALGGGLGWEF